MDTYERKTWHLPKKFLASFELALCLKLMVDMVGVASKTRRALIKTKSHIFHFLDFRHSAKFQGLSHVGSAHVSLIHF